MGARQRSVSRARASKSEAASSQASAKANPQEEREVEYEFGGPIGAALIVLIMPTVILFLRFAATKEYKFNVFNALELLEHLPESASQLWNLKAFLVIVGWFIGQVLLERTLFYEPVDGVVLSTGERLKYRISAHLQFWVTLLILDHGFPYWDSEGSFIGLGRFPLAWLYDNYLELAFGSIVFSVALSGFLYLKSFKQGALLAKGGNTGNHIYDFYIGRELNPRIWGDFDIKEFCELRPGLIGLAVLNAGCAAKQMELFGYVTPEMIMINVFHGLYVFDAMYHERAILTTMDITTDGFGYMLALGDLSWVPFTFSLQARYLVENSPGLSPQMLALICVLNFVGYWVFRGSNSEKDAFRRDPKSMPHLKTMDTKAGRMLLISGWWGMARKINYTGDWLMGLAWCMTTGTGCIATYFYAIYLFSLLIHRAIRDDHACSIKFGEDWKRYKAEVPYAFIPGLI